MTYNETDWCETRPTGGPEAEQQDDVFFDMFADPDPFDTFSFTFPLPKNSSVTINLKGHKAELGQTLNSTGLTIWRASELLCNYLSTVPEKVKNKSVLELGSGLGLCSIYTYALGASKTIMTDGDSDALANLRSNVALNKLSEAEEKVCCKQLRWGLNVEGFRDEVGGRVNVVTGADIIYIEEVIEPLFRTVEEMLLPEGIFLLAYARRNVKIDRVFEGATAAGFRWVEPEGVEGVFLFERIR